MPACATCGKWVDEGPRPESVKHAKLVAIWCEECQEKRSAELEAKKQECPRCKDRDVLQPSGICFMCEVKEFIDKGDE